MYYVIQGHEAYPYPCDLNCKYDYRHAHMGCAQTNRGNCMYRVGFPLWKVAARLGVPVLFRVHVMRDEEAGVLIATSPDLKGLVVEAETKEELINEIYHCVNALMEENLRVNHVKPVAAWDGAICAA